MLQTYQKISRYFFVILLIVFAVITGGIGLQTRQQSKCLARLLPQSPTPETNAMGNRQ